MKRSWQIVVVLFTAYAALPSGIVRAESDPSSRDLGSEVRGVFAAKCAACHGADLVKPRGRFGYVLDLRRVAENTEMVIPGQPSESELWELVRRNEMPPPDSPRGPLSSDQKEIIRDWIAAGAPDAYLTASDSPPAVQAESTGTSFSELGVIGRFMRWAGKFHLVMLHFPIALFFAAGVGEAWSAWKKTPRPSDLVRFCLWLGALAAIPTAALGWLFAAGGNGIGSPQLLMAHRWLGTSAAAWLVLTTLIAERDARREVRSLTVRMLLMVGIAITAVTAHLGGLLARGQDFFTY